MPEEITTANQASKQQTKVDKDPFAFDEIYSTYLNSQFIESLSNHGKRWLARALINTLVIDKSIDQSEMCYLEDAISLVETDQERKELKQAVKERKLLPVDNLDTDRSYAGHFFYYLAMNVAADGKIKKNEVDYLMQVCGKLGFPPKSAKEVMRWAVDQVKLNNQRQAMVEGFRHVAPIFAGY